MKLLIITLLVAYASADVSHIVQNPEAQAKILSQDQDIGVEGNYQFRFETDNGISTSGQGSLKNVQAENPAQVAQGEVSWTAPNGEVVSFQYLADENGYQAQGPFIPTPPPIPDAIIKALEYIRANPPKEVPYAKQN